MWVFVVIGYLLLVGLAAWFGGGAVMTVAAGGFVLAVALWLLDGLLADLLRGPLRWLAKPFRALASAAGTAASSEEEGEEDESTTDESLTGDDGGTGFGTEGNGGQL